PQVTSSRTPVVPARVRPYPVLLSKACSSHATPSPSSGRTRSLSRPVGRASGRPPGHSRLVTGKSRIPIVVPRTLKEGPEKQTEELPSISRDSRVKVATREMVATREKFTTREFNRADSRFSRDESRLASLCRDSQDDVATRETWRDLPQILNIFEDARLARFAQFRDYHAERFSGQGDPRIVDEWIQGLEFIFEVMECPDRYRVVCAQLQLTGDARLWWNAYWSMRPGEKVGCTWDMFKDLVRDTYYPSYYRAEMERQFLALQQGTRTVDEYEREFTRLAGFAPDLVRTEAQRAQR
ncbi:Unknown protein, partial [Striga hermonthica]